MPNMGARDKTILSYRNDRVRMLRMERGLQQYELAYKAGISQGHMSSIERGETNSIGSLILENLARVLGTSVDYLVGTSNDPRPASVKATQLTFDEQELLNDYRKIRDVLLQDAVRQMAKALIPVSEKLGDRPTNPLGPYPPPPIQSSESKRVDRKVEPKG